MNEVELWDVDSGAYHAERDHDSSSSLKTFLKCPLTYWTERVSGHGRSEPPSQAMQLGTALHAKLLEPDTFSDAVVVANGVTRRQYGQWERLVNQLRPGQTLVTEDEFGALDRMADSIYDCREAAALMEAPGECELSLRWRDAETGVGLKVRFDKLLADGRIVDVKTSSDPYQFARSCVDYGYHISAALYCEGRDLYLPPEERDRDFLWIVVGSKPPHETLVCRCGPRSMALGRELVHRAVRGIADCWSFYGRESPWHSLAHGRVTEIELPEWALRQGFDFSLT